MKRNEKCKISKQNKNLAVGIVDSFGISDFILNSTIGRSDGDVYNAIFSKTTNNSHPKYRTVEGESPYFGSWIKPTLQSKLWLRIKCFQEFNSTNHLNSLNNNSFLKFFIIFISEMISSK